MGWFCKFGGATTSASAKTQNHRSRIAGHALTDQSEIVSLGSVGSCGKAYLTSTARTHFAKNFHDSKTNGWHAVQNPSGNQAFVCLLRTSCPIFEGNTSTQNIHVAVTQILLSTMHTEPTPHFLVHVPPAIPVDVTSTTQGAHPKQALSTARQQ